MTNKYYIYVIYSEQFGTDIYKVGFTENISNRIKDPCYTTCFHKPCSYQAIWEYETSCDNAECVEKDLHRELTSDSNNMKNDSNRCTEMYNIELEKLISLIGDILTVNANVTSLHQVEQELLGSYVLNDNIFQNGEYKGHTHTTPNNKREKCHDCNRSIKYCYEISHCDKSYYFGEKCYNNHVKQYVKPKVDNRIKKILNEHNILDAFYNDDVADLNVADELILHKAFIKLVDKSESDFKCKCCNEYYLCKLSKKFTQHFRINTNRIDGYNSKEKHVQTRFKNLLNSMGIFNIVDNHISLKLHDKKIQYIATYFNNSALIDLDSCIDNITNIDKCFLYNRTILSGCAGSGKTTGIFGFIDRDLSTNHVISKLSNFFSSEKQVLILAFTGKAVSEVKKKYDEIKKFNDESPCDGFEYLNNMKATFKTIDSYLIPGKYSDTRKYDLVIIDEFSMVTLDHLYDIINKIQGSNIILMGDENQLSPIGSPSIVDELLENRNEKIIYGRMNVCKRTKNLDLKKLFEYLSNKNSDSSIKKLQQIYNKSLNINFIAASDISEYIRTDGSYETKILVHKNDTRKNLFNTYKKSHFKKPTYMCTKNIYTHDASEVIKLINNLINKKKICLSKDSSNTEDFTLTDNNIKELKHIEAYLKTIDTTAEDGNENTYKLMFYNGYEFIYGNCIISYKVLEIVKKIISFCIDRDLCYDSSNVMTIHKAQGSGYHTVIIDARHSEYEFLDPKTKKKLLYTATTRAKNRVIYITE